MARTCTLWYSTAVLGLMAALSGCESMPTLPSNVVTQTFNMDTPANTLELKPAPDARVWVDGAQEVINNRASGYGLVHLPQVQTYLDGLLQKIRTEAGVPQWPGKVYISASSDLNAYTQGSGNVYISLGLLAQMENEDELIGVLAHEFAHTYLQYAELQEAALNPQKDSEISSIVNTIGQNLQHTGVAKNPKQEKAMRNASTLLSAYQMGRSLVGPAWSRAQEHAADDMAVQLSIRLGYSVTDGWIKALERTMAYDKQAEVIQNKQREALNQSFNNVRDAALSQVGSQNFGANMGNMLSQELVGNLTGAGKDLAQMFTSSHPDTAARIARISALNDKLMGSDRPRPQSRQRDWSKIKKTRAVQAMFASYLNAAQAQALLGTSPDSEVIKIARKSLVQETQGHAMPALLGWQVNRNDPALLRALQANMKSPQHRAWKSYVLYAEHLLAQNKKRDAQKVMDDGFQHFKASPLAWQDYIRLQAQLNNTAKANQMAAECGQKFQPYAQGCLRAAVPAPTVQALNSSTSIPGAVSGSITGAISGALSGILSGSAPAGASSVGANNIQGAVTNSLTGAISNAISGAIPGAAPSVGANNIQGAVSSSLTGALSNAISGAIPGATPTVGASNNIKGAVSQSVKGTLSHAVTSAIPGVTPSANPNDISGAVSGAFTNAISGALTNAISGATPQR